MGTQQSSGLLPRVVGHVLIAATVVVAVDQLPAIAGHGKLPKADNSDHSLQKHSLTANGSTAFDHGVAELGKYLNAYQVTSGNADVEVYDGAYGDVGWYGIASCKNLVASSGGTRCDDFTVKFNTSAMPNDDGKWKHLGCHEFGHTVGLGHRSAASDPNSDSCMRETIWPTQFDSHDDDQISG